MSRQIVITLPDDHNLDRDAEYVRAVADQVADGYLSGHVDADHHWSFA